LIARSISIATPPCTARESSWPWEEVKRRDDVDHVALVRSMLMPSFRACASSPR
jgi:hypothetical protein